MFPTILPWPMTLAPMNEAISCDNHAEQKLVLGGEITNMISEVTGFRLVWYRMLGKNCFPVQII
jgi:hypothetical protein